jgi:hypothetical protein
MQSLNVGKKKSIKRFAFQLLLPAGLMCNEMHPEVKLFTSLISRKKRKK